uniref:DUF223 domain-containing protein n=1 Tax=Brassica oleracea var. oleracea TaxID=109376 RepID=A0A0D3B927_BRAOL
MAPINRLSKISQLDLGPSNTPRLSKKKVCTDKTERKAVCTSATKQHITQKPSNPSEHSLGFLRFWDSLKFKKDKEFVGITVLFLDEKVNSVIYEFTPVRRANHYMPYLKEGSIVKVDHFEVARCSSMYTITDHSFLIRLISLIIIDEVITGAPEINLQSRLECSTIAK